VVTCYMRDEDPLRSLDQAKEMLIPLQTPHKMPNIKRWGIELKVEGCLVGTCGFCRWDQQHHHAEIGYDLCLDYWGRGLMTEAITMIPQYGITGKELNRIEATTHTESWRFQRVLQKLGFQKEGILREYYCRDGLYNDQITFSLLRSEWAGGTTGWFRGGKA